MTGGQVLWRPDADVRTEVDEILNMQCGDPAHPKGQSYHTADAAAEFMLVNPCCGDRVFLCRSRAHYLKYIAAEICCYQCKRMWAPGAYRFIPLPGVLPL